MPVWLWGPCLPPEPWMDVRGGEREEPEHERLSHELLGGSRGHLSSGVKLQPGLMQLCEFTVSEGDVKPLDLSELEGPPRLWASACGLLCNPSQEVTCPCWLISMAQ
uniref:Uncharacterized protein n=1 Tax=Mus musculus TaxID=10090 RepID=Q3TYR2_MOUSE|nr:unnamed protein product [Mus musculus]